MMNLRTLSLGCALIFALAAGGALAQNAPTSSPSQNPSMQTPPSKQDPTKQQPSAEGPAEGYPTSATSLTSDEDRAFLGSLAMQGGKYVLHSANGDYKLTVSDDDQAKTLQGRDVRVTGTLDSDTNMIHVKSIEPSSTM